MALTATDTIPASVGGLGPVFEYETNLSAGVDKDIKAASSTTSRVWVVGLLMSEGTATNLTIKTLTKSITIELAANQGIYDKTGKGFIFAGKPGETVTFSSTADVTGLQTHMVDGAAMRACD